MRGATVEKINGAHSSKAASSGISDLNGPTLQTIGVLDSWVAQRRGPELARGRIERHRIAQDDCSQHEADRTCDRQGSAIAHISESNESLSRDADPAAAHRRLSTQAPNALLLITCQRVGCIHVPVACSIAAEADRELVRVEPICACDSSLAFHKPTMRIEFLLGVVRIRCRFVEKMQQPE